MDEYMKKRILDSMNETMEITVKKQVSFLMLEKYLKGYGEEASEEDRNLVPLPFLLSEDWDQKNRILKEAIDENRLIKDCLLYPTIIEGYQEEEEKTH